VVLHQVLALGSGAHGMCLMNKKEDPVATFATTGS
jgi:hypothetical protein